MRILSGILLAGALILAAPNPARAEKQTCLDTSRVRNWVVVNDETLLLDAGSKKYRVSLRQSCFNLGTSPVLQFKADPITRRICGSSLDAIRVQGEQCPISDIQEIDKQTFRDAQKKTRGSLRLKKSAG